MKRTICGALLLLWLSLGVGCLGGIPLDRYCYVLDLGIEPGEIMPYRFVFLLNEDTAGAGEETEDRGKVSMVCAEERSLFAAIEALAGALPAQLSFERTTLLAFSRELAEAGEIETLTDVALNRLKIRQNIRIIVVEGDMQEAFRGLISEGDPSMNRLKTNVKLYEEHYGFVEDWGLARVKEAFHHEAGDALLPFAAQVEEALTPNMAGGQTYPYLGGRLLGEGQIKTSLCGSAVFSGSRMVGVLSGQHTMLVLMAKGTFRAGHLHLPWKNGRGLDFALYAVGKPRRSVNKEGFCCEITLEADLEQPAQVDATSQELIAALEAYLEQELLAVFRATAALEADVFCLGREAMGRFSTWDSWQAYGFSHRLKDMKPCFRVRVKLSHSPQDPALE